MQHWHSLYIAQSWLHKLMADRYHKFDLVFLEAMDILLAPRQSEIQLAATRLTSLGGDSTQ